MKFPHTLRLCLGVLAAAGLAGPGLAHAAFPERAVTIVVPYPAGGGTDTVARKLAQTLSGHWKVPVVVENVPGAEGLIGSERVLRMPADGYTLLFQISQMMLWKKTVPNSKVDALNDFRYVSKIQTSPLAFGVSPKLPVTSIKEYVQWCRSQGGCAWGSGSAYAQLMGRQLMDVAGVPDAINVPYKGTAPMMTD
ncbi:MAG TPA: tripartite tricarboxylate transporter substrate binding protein, partial [Bordetella sp.]|nr:tripartite tricarboxylate transporter substrate binding protein [Bordetella sp.]